MELIDVTNRKLVVAKFINFCPCCHTAIKALRVGTHFNEYTDQMLYLLLKCDVSYCQSCFTAVYEAKEPNSNEFVFIKVVTGTPIQTTFEPLIKRISPQFVKIYNEASFAEQAELFEISGVGYRKALEFLIKDYVIYLNPNDEALIKKKTLGDCISFYLTDPEIKESAKRATWLGNDETHYIRKWENHDLQDLKFMMEMTRYFIFMKLSFSERIADMPS